MPVKTGNCVFSEERIYPGHGMNFVRRDGKMFTFINCKTRHLFLGGRKALNQRWCKQWRRAHKKESILRQVKKGHGKKTLKTERGIEGLSLQDLLRKKNESAADRKKLSSKPSTQRPQTKQAKKADLNARLRELRKKRKEAEEQKQSGGDKGGAKKAGAKKPAGGGKKSGGGAGGAGGKKKGGGKKGGGKKGGGKK